MLHQVWERVWSCRVSIRRSLRQFSRKLRSTRSLKTPIRGRSGQEMRRRSKSIYHRKQAYSRVKEEELPSKRSKKTQVWDWPKKVIKQWSLQKLFRLLTDRKCFEALPSIRRARLPCLTQTLRLWVWTHQIECRKTGAHQDLLSLMLILLKESKESEATNWTRNCRHLVHSALKLKTCLWIRLPSKSCPGLIHLLAPSLAE